MRYLLLSLPAETTISIVLPIAIVLVTVLFLLFYFKQDKEIKSKERANKKYIASKRVGRTPSVRAQLSFVEFDLSTLPRTDHQKLRKQVVTVLRWVILVVVLLAIYLPLIMIMIYSFSGARAVGDAFGEFTFSQYANLFHDEKLLTATSNTLIIGVVSALLATILGTTAAVGIHYMRRRWRTAVDTASQITVVNAEIVTAMGFFLLMLFMQNTVKLPVNFGLGWLIVAHTVITTPYVLLTVSPRLKQLNPNLLEASMDLGAGAFRSLVTVLLPQLAGAMVSGFALAFTLSLDDFVITNINGGTVDTISTYVYAGIRHKLNPDIRALSTIIFALVLGILIVGNVVKNKRLKEQAHK